MRLATAFDEIEPLKDPRVRVNPGYAKHDLLRTRRNVTCRPVIGETSARPGAGEPVPGDRL